MSDLAQVRKELEALQRQLRTLERGLGARARSPLPQGEADALVCGLGGQIIAFLLERVDEVVPMAKLARVPESPPWLLGVLTLRRQAVPVVDTSARLLGVPRGVRVEDFIVVGHFGEQRSGLLVQSVEGVVHVEAGDIDAATGALDGVETDYIVGYFPSELGTTLLIDPARLVGAMPLDGGEDE